MEVKKYNNQDQAFGMNNLEVVMYVKKFDEF